MRSPDRAGRMGSGEFAEVPRPGTAKSRCSGGSRGNRGSPGRLPRKE